MAEADSVFLYWFPMDPKRNEAWSEALTCKEVRNLPTLPEILDKVAMKFDQLKINALCSNVKVKMLFRINVCLIFIHSGA